jgi:hypothetical protein
VVNGAAASKAGRSFIAMSDDTRAAIKAGKRLPDIDKPAEALTDADIAATNYYYRPQRRLLHRVSAIAGGSQLGPKEFAGIVEATGSRTDSGKQLRRGTCRVLLGASVRLRSAVLA